MCMLHDHRPGLDTSPVRPHLFAWLESGGSLLVVTSDDGHRPWRQLLGQYRVDVLSLPL